LDEYRSFILKSHWQHIKPRNLHFLTFADDRPDLLRISDHTLAHQIHLFGDDHESQSTVEGDSSKTSSPPVLLAARFTLTTSLALQRMRAA
jgi:hypothetical protein